MAGKMLWRVIAYYNLKTLSGTGRWWDRILLIDFSPRAQQQQEHVWMGLPLLIRTRRQTRIHEIIKGCVY